MSAGLINNGKITLPKTQYKSNDHVTFTAIITGLDRPLLLIYLISLSRSTEWHCDDEMIRWGEMTDDSQAR
jgi:hypothetical protein